MESEIETGIAQQFTEIKAPKAKLFCSSQNREYAIWDVFWGSCSGVFLLMEATFLLHLAYFHVSAP